MLRMPGLPRFALPISHIVVGLGVGITSMRAVCVRGRRVTWSREIDLAEDASIEAALEELLSAAPRYPLQSVRVVAAVGPARSQLRRLHGLPPLKDRRLLAALVRAEPTRYFLQNGVPIVTTGTGAMEDGSAWAGAIDQPVVDAITLVCRRLWRSTVVVPTAAVLHHVIRDDQFEWRDGDVVLTIAQKRRVVASCRRERRQEFSPPAVNVAQLSTNLTFHGDRLRFADALGAAQLSARATLVHRSGRSRAKQAPLPLWRLSMAAVCAMAAITFAIAAPALAALRAEGRLRIELSSVAVRSTSAMGVERELGHAMALLTELTSLDRSTRSMTLSLAELTRALRAPSMLVSFRADSAGGTLIALTSHADSLIEMLESDPELGPVAIVGPVTPEPGTGNVLSRPGIQPTSDLSSPSETDKRVMIRFRWAKSSASGNAIR